MILRLVRLTLDPHKTNDFLTLFEQNKAAISSFPGCIELQILQDISQENIFYTHSKWENEDALEAYRNSELFKNVWTEAKKCFSDRAQAVSLRQRI